MNLPKYNQLWQPILKLLSQSEPMRTADFIDPLARYFDLSEECIAQNYPSGSGNIFHDRVSWALSYLAMAGLVERPRRGVYVIAASGMQVADDPSGIEQRVNAAMSEREPGTKRRKNRLQEIPEPLKMHVEDTPLEALDAAYVNIRQTIYDDILRTILSKTPYEFEKLVVALLQRMGYGGEIENSGIVTKASNDLGVDGIIKEDILGFDTIHIQAKRYQLDQGITREDIQKFVGALGGFKSNKGVFITTSYFKNTAVEYAKNQSLAKIVLIDGKKLAEYIYDSGLGMQTEKVLEIKKLDSDFWEMMKNA